VKRTSTSLIALSIALSWTSTAHAQRAGDNALTSAQDAFGTTVGNESIGLYSTNNVRGFDPIQASNARIEGLYFDRQAEIPNRIINGSSVRVGISAQSYLFPAPTGIVDYRLNIPGDQQVVSAVVTVGPYETYEIEADAQVPIIADKLSVAAGIGAMHETWQFGGNNALYTFGGTVRWRPTESIEIMPFGAMIRRRDYEGPFTVLTGGGAYLPPEIERGLYYGQQWSEWNTRQSTYGIIARASFGDDWTLRGGLFNSRNYREHMGENLFLNVQPDGTATRSVVLYPATDQESFSGEVRLSRVFTEGPRRHTLHASVRGRDKRRTYGGASTYPLGPGTIGVLETEPRPIVTYNPSSFNDVRQGTVGIAYEGLWPKVGETSIGIQKTSYKRVSRQPGLPPVTSKDKPWLFYGSMALYVTTDLAVYGSYTRGLEESAEAPASAANRGAPVDASRTSQVDGGIRYAVTPQMRLVAGLFQVKKPFFNLNSANVFEQLGGIRHRGAEISLTGQPIEGLTVVAGVILLQARISGEPVTTGRIGNVPLGRTPLTARLNLQYGPKAWQGFSVDGQVEHLSSRYANVLNTVRIEGRQVVNLGARYRFNIAGADATLRFQVQNVADVFRWDVNATASFQPIDRRRFTVSLAADF